jgi:PAS domain S-box-containing protein
MRKNLHETGLGSPEPGPRRSRSHTRARPGFIDRGVIEKILQRAAEQSSAGVLITDVKGSIQYINSHYCRMTGYTPEEVIGRNPRIFKSERTSREVHRNLWQTILGGEEWRGEFCNRDKSGGLFWENAVISPIRNEAGQITHFLGIKVDVTGRKRAEEALRESEQRFREVAEIAEEWIWEVNIKGLYTYSNPTVESILGVSPEEIVGKKHFYDLFVPEAREELAKRAFEVFEKQESFCNFINSNIHKNGSNILLQTSGRPIRDQHGALIGYRGVDIDVTERKRTERALLESEEQMRALFEHSMIGILLGVPDGDVLAANPAACQLFGRTENDICRMGRAGLIDRRDPRVADFFREWGQKGHAMGEMTFIRADGTRFDALATAVGFETEAGSRTTIMIQDISEQKMAEDRIREFSRKMLSAREEEKRQLSAVLHHDVGSITVGVAARMNAAEDDILEGKNKEALASLRECRQLFTQSIEKLKTLAMELRPPDLDLLGLRAALRQHFLQVAGGASLRIRFIDYSRGILIIPDTQTVLFRAVQECLNNVAKHACAREVRVTLSAPRQRIRLTISDDGKGFDTAGVASKPGMHLGLRALQEMVASLGGTLHIDSQPDKGTRVKITIPGKQESRYEHTSTDRRRSPARTRRVAVQHRTQWQEH